MKRFNFFTTQLYSMIAKGVGEWAMPWAANRGIDLFQKRLVFVPVNQDLHWSLAVLVNPGAVTFSLPTGGRHAQSDTSLPMPCILTMDSLSGQHCAYTVSSDLRRWLNLHWESLGYHKVYKRMSPFNEDSLPLVQVDGTELLCSARFSCIRVTYLTL